MKNKKIIIAAAALVALIALMAGVWFATRPESSGKTENFTVTDLNGNTDENGASDPTLSEGTKKFTVTVIHGDQSENVFHYATDAAYLGPVLLEAGLISGSEGPYGLMIEAVDGETASWDENQSYWAFYVGEEYAVTGIDLTPVNDGDTFKLVYTIG